MRYKCVAAVLTASALVLASTACSGSDNGSAGGGASATTIRTPIIADPPPLDPDVYYQPDGLLIMTSAYEGLLRYANGSTKLEGLLATKWDVSPDGLKYEFTLRDGVKFSDGTPFDSAAAKATFQRRIDMAAGPSYMLAEVSDMQTPDPQTFVVTLKKPVAAFLDYLASPYGPLMTSPTAVAEHAAGADRASAWLGSHTAGTGPYELTAVAPSSKYTLTANKNYWGEAPQITTVDIPVIADPAVQRLQLDNGQLDMVLHGLTKSDYDALASGPNTEVVHQKALVKALMMVNPESQVFGSPAARTALNEAFDRTALTKNVFGAQAVPSTQFYPNGMLPDGAGVPLDGWRNPMLEAEIAVHVAGDGTITGMSAAIELADVAPPPADPEPILAGDIFTRHVVLGPVISGRTDSRGVVARITVDGAEVASTDDVTTLVGELGDVVATTAAVLAEHGDHLRDGQFIMTGSVFPPLAVTPGQRVQVDLHPLGTLALSFA